MRPVGYLDSTRAPVRQTAWTLALSTKPDQTQNQRFLSIPELSSVGICIRSGTLSKMQLPDMTLVSCGHVDSHTLPLPNARIPPSPLLIRLPRVLSVGFPNCWTPLPDSPIEQILAGIIERKKRLNRMVELQSKMMLNVHELREFQFLRQEFKQYVADLAKQKAQSHDIRGSNGIGKVGQRS
jgi:hypothetical protein